MLCIRLLTLTCTRLQSTVQLTFQIKPIKTHYLESFVEIELQPLLHDVVALLNKKVDSVCVGLTAVVHCVP